MLTVAILKNGHPLMARSAVNKLKTEGVYICDDGTRIEHDPKDGAVALAKKMLDTIVETQHPENGGKHE